MKTKLKNRYYCDFCKKSGCSARHMRDHEERCTLNPKRVCGMCLALHLGDDSAVQRPIAELLAALPEWEEPGDISGEENGYTHGDLSISIVELRALTRCPACILAAIRQKGIPVAAVSGFDFAAEMKDAFVIANEARHAAEYGINWPYDVH